MGDRYYSQMANALKLKPSELNDAINNDYEALEAKVIAYKHKEDNVKKGKPAKITKKMLEAELSEMLGVVNVKFNCNKPELELFISSINSKRYNKPTAPMPTGRLKAPYIEVISKAFGITEDISGLSVAALNALVGEIYK